jgi:WD40 repeat protein/serine/threonine protein kinase
VADWNPKANELFLAAAEIEAPAERLAFLDEQCGADADLRRQVEALLAANDQAGSFLTEPVVASSVGTVDYKPVSEGTGAIIGAYKLLQKIGEGGFGVVFMAEQQQPIRRMVALKILKPGLDTAQVIARFESERQALALMNHPHIANVLDAGATASGRPYFVMELVKGVPITQFCDKNHLPPEIRLKLFIDVCHAIEHAHHKGVIHRDIKPSNVMVTLHDGVPVVKVIDFGVAKATVQKLTEKTLFTAYGEMVGTPAYMSPEQAEMSGLDIDTRSDIFSLGVLLYELLTGTTPLESKRLRAAGYAEMQRLIREEEPARPSTRLSSLGDSATVMAGNRGLDVKRLVQLLTGDLDWVVMKALEKDRNRRYGTPGSFAEDIERYLRREPILARPPTTAYKLKKFAQRNRAAVLTAAAVAAALLAGTAVATWQAVRARRAEVEMLAVAEEEKRSKEAAQEERNKATEAQKRTAAALKREEEERKKANEARNQMAASLEREQLTSYVHRIALAHREWLANNVGRAEQILGDCPADLRNWEWHYVKRLCHAEQLIFRGHAGEVTAVAFSADGSRVASTSWKEAKVWNAATGKEILELSGQAGWSTAVAFSHDGKRLATAGFQTAKVWDAVSGKELLSIRAHDYLVKGVAFSPDGRRLATASGTPSGAGRREGGEVKIWDTDTGKELFRFANLPHWANSVAFSPDGKYLAAATGDLYVVAPSRPGEVRVWDAANGNEVLTLRGHTFWVTSVAFSPDSKRLVSGGADRTVRIWEVPTGRELLNLRGHSGWVRGVSFSPQGDRLASVGDDQVVRVWDAATGQETLVLRGHTHPIRAVAFSPDGRRLASASGDSLKPGEVRVWDLTADHSARTFRDHTAPVTSVAFSPDGKFLASASNGMSSARPGEAKIREVATGLERLALAARMFGFTAVAFSPDGASVATAGDEGVKLWDAQTGNQLRLFKVFAHPMHGMAFSPDGKRVAAVGVSGVMVWDAATGQELHNFRGHTINAYGIAFSPDGKRFATSSWGGYLSREVEGVKKTEKMPNEIKVWDTVTGKELFTLSGGGLGVAFSPDGKLLASGSQEGTVTIWDVGTGNVLLTLSGHAGAVPAVAFSRDSRRLATASADHTVKVWDVRSGHEVLTLRGHEEPVSSVAFSPDGRYVASASTLAGSPGQVKIWDAAVIEP